MHDFQYTQDSLLARIDTAHTSLTAPSRRFVSLRTKVHETPLSKYPHYTEVSLPFVRMNCVYIVQMGPYFKLGYTDMPRHRVTNIAGALPVRPVPICLIKVAYAEELEYALHKRFAAVRTKGEWFLLTAADVRHCFELAKILPEYYPGEWFEGQEHKADRRCKVVELCDSLLPSHR